VIIKCKDKCVLRIKKLHQEDLRKVSSHNLRKIKVANADGTKNIHPLQVRLNDTDLTSDLRQVMLKKLSDHGIRSIATNAICGIELVFSVSNGFFNDDIMKSFDIESNVNKHRLADWTNMTASWLRNMFGDNLLQMQLHLDETTPHIHAVVLPLVEKPIIKGTGLRKGESVLKMRLCGSDVLRKSWYFHMQTEYSKAVKVLGLERGEYQSKAAYKDLRKLEALQKELELMKLENDKLNKDAASYKAELKMMRHEIVDEKRRYDALKQLVDNKKKIIMQLDDYRAEQQTKIKTLESTKQQREAEIANLQKAGNALSQNYETLKQQVLEKKDKLVKFDDYRDTRKSEISELVAIKQKYEAKIKTLQNAKKKLDNQELPKQLNEMFGSYLRTFKAMELFAELILDESKVVTGVCDEYPGLKQIGYRLKRARDDIQEILRQHARHLKGLNNAETSPPKFSNETSSGRHSLPVDGRQLKTGRN
jgi:hypothetical protein